jgi:plastocyanin
VKLNKACALVMLCLPVAACGDRDSERPGFSAEPAQAQVTATGALEGFVRLAGESLPGATRVQNTTDPEACGLEHSLEDLLVSEETRGVQHVIAALVDVPAGRVSTGSPERLLIDNRDCRFAPHVLVAQVGDTIGARNSDQVVHTTHYNGALASNVALPPLAATVSRVFAKPGMIIVLCDLHGWMRAYVRVDEHRFHAVSTAAGSFRIAEIPPGDYTLELWHEKLGTQRVQVQIRANETTRLEIEYALPPSPS